MISPTNSSTVSVVKNSFFQTFSRLTLFISVVLLSASCTTDYSDVKNTYNTGRVIARPARLSVYKPSVKQQSVKARATSAAASHAPAKPATVLSPLRSPILSPLNPRKMNIGKLNSMLFKASEQGDIGNIWKALERGANISAANSNGETALHSAAAHNQVEAVRALLDSGANANAKTILGWTPLHSAARFGSSAAVSVLLQAGTNANHRNASGKTALALAKQAQHMDVVRILQR